MYVRGSLIGSIAIGFVLALALAAKAAPVVVHLKDGRQITCDMVGQTADTLKVKIAGIDSDLPLDQVLKVTPIQSFEEEYELRRKEVAPDDHGARYRLARWLHDKGVELTGKRKYAEAEKAYQSALQELETILKAKPGDLEADLLKGLVVDKLKVLPKEAPPGTQPTPKPVEPDEPDEPTDDPAADKIPAPKLTKEQINLIKVYEIRLSENPTVVISRKTTDEILKKYRRDPVMEPYIGRRGEAMFRTLRGEKLLEILFALKAREFYGEVTIRETPKSILDFIPIHNGLVVRHCGRCHGEGKAPGYYVVTRYPTREETRYTNLMLLRRTYAGAFPLIFKTQPEQSPLLQFALPRRDATNPHPDVKNFRPFFTSTRDRGFTEAVQWIYSLYGESEDYPIDFTPPVIPREPQESPEPQEPPQTPSPAPTKAPAGPATPPTPTPPARPAPPSP